MDALYDNEKFFHNYLNLRRDAKNYNDLFEQPQMMDMLPDVRGKQILELGCGYGATSIKFIKRGAEYVYAFDISKNMIEKAQKENSHKKIMYSCMNMDDLDKLAGTWDIAFSSLAFHYVENIEQLFQNINHILVPEGVLLFSMEHPIVTAAMKECVCEFDSNGEPLYFKLDHYGKTGERNVVWLDTLVKKYHRTVADIVNSLLHAGFIIDELREPLPEVSLMESNPRMHQEIHRPSYLMCRCHKKDSDN
ncbi:Malonyl-[acyl-carrier protein] O-methyltransferase [Eubacteriaceae bacterium CHKCI004]|nr:Malonyl-[acyl-carrier protein] O-methyltransferase [Eubacteriaceae bacterium CHKCI004]